MDQIDSHNGVIYIFDNYSWSDIKAAFLRRKIIISGGSAGRRHLLSAVQAKLSFFLILINGLRPYNINQSFYHEDKLFKLAKTKLGSGGREIQQNSTIKSSGPGRVEKCIDSLKFSNKRGYHTSTIIKIAPSESSNHSNPVLNYMDSIKAILNNHRDNTYEAQKLIETS
jgi:hypothetical protein